MRTLFLDFASNKGSVACVSEQGFCSFLSTESRIGDAEVMQMIAKACEKAGWPLCDSGRIACVTGPGGFMSLRTAVSIANALGWSLKIPIAGVHLSEIYGARMCSDGVWLHSTRREQMFVRGFGVHAALWPAPTIITLEDCVATLPQNVLWCGELLPEHRDALSAGKNIRDSNLLTPEKALPQVLQNLSYSPTSLRPWYGRAW